jgi:hypothetical protein
MNNVVVESGIRDGEKNQIRDKHPESAILQLGKE